ncbi:MAG: HAMP domain-containing histidine kinase [Oscillospiraceae bacterium]|nr:HAMP domain-containing histidine kinase [Oscillospiraceae bacterium]
MTASFYHTAIIAALICLLLYGGLNHLINYTSLLAFDNPRYEQSHAASQKRLLQNYIKRQHISSSELSKLEAWEQRHPITVMNIYSEGERVYCSQKTIYQSSMTAVSDALVSNHTFPLELSDKTVTLILYTDYSYQFYLFSSFFAMILAFVLYIFIFMKSSRKQIRYIHRLNDEVQILEGGNLDYTVTVQGNDEITDLANSMNRMRLSFQQQMETEQQLRQANQRLITEMSHDLRTPLTGIMLYLEILRSHHYESEEEWQTYLNKIEEKAQQMKAISDHLFAYSRDVQIRKLSAHPMEETFEPLVQSFIHELEGHGFSVVSDLFWIECLVEVNQEYIQRIFSNIQSNIQKYADTSQDIWLSTIDTPTHCGFSVMNTRAQEARDVESNSVGVESIKELMQQMQGSCTVEETDCMYEITLLFPKQ